jgi:predicted 3-demethylubiquinone-9 3-methyltransferase (glyoxalase superfamily)/uncharacterized protein YndB with AHSA1/START domain
MPATADAILEDHEGRTVLRFERVLHHSPERVWSALTEVDDLRQWHPSPFELERRAGGVVAFEPPAGVAFGPGVVRRYDPPRVLAHSWGEDELRWELEPCQEGTRLVLTHTFEDRLKAARDAAGWELCFRGLVASLAAPPGRGSADAPTGARAISDAGWDELNTVYQERFGIAPGLATPAPAFLAESDAVTPLLMFVGDAEEAMRFYVSVFFPARIEQLERHGPGDPGAEGSVKYATLRLGDRLVHCIDSPPVHSFTFTPAVSLAVRGANADTVQTMFARLSEGGEVLMPLDTYPFSELFAWVTDRFGVSWQLSTV